MRNTVYLILIFWKVWQAFGFQGSHMVVKGTGVREGKYCTKDTTQQHKHYQN